jgi:hypothetical protein
MVLRVVARSERNGSGRNRTPVPGTTAQLVFSESFADSRAAESLLAVRDEIRRIQLSR